MKHNALQNAGAIAHLQKLQAPLVRARVHPALQRDCLAGMLRNFFDADYAHQITNLQISAVIILSQDRAKPAAAQPAAARAPSHQIRAALAARRGKLAQDMPPDGAHAKRCSFSQLCVWLESVCVTSRWKVLSGEFRMVQTAYTRNDVRFRSCVFGSNLFA